MSLLPASHAPSREDLAASFYGEGVRDLQDARILHTHRRWPGAIAASMHASEKALKAAIILSGGLGWFDLNTHEPYTRMENHPLLRPLVSQIMAVSLSLTADLRLLEELTPKTQFMKGTLVEGRNPEYPYVDTTTFALECPDAVFTEAESERFYRVARQVLELVRGLSPALQTLGLRLPRRL